MGDRSRRQLVLTKISWEMRRSLVISLLFVCVALAEDLSTLQSVQIFFRHGQRLPTVYPVYPTENQKMAEGLVKGEMTKVGIQQEFNLGQNLKQTYGKFIGERYNSTELLVLSGFDNRTSQSVLAVLAALLPPQEDQIFHERLMWQPIPVHTDSILDMVSFGSFDNCPALQRNVRTMSKYQHMDDSYSDLVTYFEKNAGVKIPDAFIFQKVLDSIKTRKDMQDVLPLPSWANDTSFINHVERVCDELHSRFIDLIVDSTGAWHYDMIVKNIRDRIHGNSKHKTYLFGAHDANFMTMAKYINLSDLQSKLTPYASYLAFEHHKVDGKDVVKIFIHYNLNGTREELTIAACPSPCAFSTFEALKYALNSDKFMGICRGYNDEAHMICQDKVTMIAILLLISISLFIGFIGALFACFWYRERVRQLTDPERRYILSN